MTNTKVKINADMEALDLIKKGLRLIRVYQAQESSWLDIEDVSGAKALTNHIDKAIENHTKKDSTPVMNDDPKCDPDANCDW